MKYHRVVFLLFGCLCVSGCSSRPEPIAFGKDMCAYCKMIISDARFGAELITAKGRIHKYDAVECMIAHIDEQAIEYQALMAIAYNDPQKLYPVDSLSFIQSADYRGPMGNTAAFYHADSLQGQQVKDWREILLQGAMRK